MSYSPIAIKRRNVLGDIYSRCDAVESIPVYMIDTSGEVLGHVDESMGPYADAFLFHLPEIICKKLSTSHFDYVFEYDYSGEKAKGGKERRIKLTSIILVPKKTSAEEKSAPAS